MKNSTVSLKDLQMILHESITQSAVESLKDSQQVANDFAKILILDILNNKESRNNLGSLLGSLFQYESVRCPTRDLIYWSIFLDPTLKATRNFTSNQVTYWLSNEGMTSTRALVMYYTLWWLRDKGTVQGTIKPLLVHVTQLDTVHDTISKVVTEALPHVQVQPDGCYSRCVRIVLYIYDCIGSMCQLYCLVSERDSAF
jgi:hypothetical protein